MTPFILSLFSMYFTYFFHLSFDFERLISYFPNLKDNFFIHFFQFSIFAAAPWKILFHLQRSLHSLLAIRFLHLRPSSLLETKPMSTPLKLISGEENHSNIEMKKITAIQRAFRRHCHPPFHCAGERLETRTTERDVVAREERVN